MESLSSQQAPDEFKEKNDDTSKIETPYTDPSINCSNLKSVSDSQNVLLVDQRNGNLDTHNAIQSEENKTLENSENLYVTENLHTDCDSRNLYQDINCEDVNRFNSSTELETDCKVSDTDDPLYLGQESKTEDRLDNETKDEIQVLNGKEESDEKSSSTLSVGDKDYVKLLVPDVPDNLENNVNNINESPFEDVNKCSESDPESHENSLQDPLLISDGSHSDNANNTNKDNELVISNNVDPSNLEDRLEPKESSHDENAQENQDNELAITEALLSESQVEDFTEHDTQKELEALLAPQSNNIVEGFGEDSILIANLSVPPPIQLIREVEEVVPIEGNSISTSKDIVNHIAKKQRLDGEFPSLEGNEGKPSLLKILPIKNGHGLWSLEELKIILEERGSVLLRLCGAPEAGNEDIIDGPKADFTALLLDDAVPIPDVNGIIEPEDELTLSQHSFMDGLNDSYLNEEYTPPFWKHRIPGSRLPCVPKKKRLPPSTRSSTPKVQSTPGQCRGRKRGRPPLHNRAWIPKMKFTPPKFINEPIKFRPPTPPPALVSDGSRLSGGLLEAALTKNAPLAIGKKNIIEPLIQKEDHMASKLHDKENEKVKKSPAAFEEEDEHLSADAFTDDNDHAGKNVDATNSQGIKPKKVMIRIPCPHCPLTFRKKLALTGHMKLRHKTLKKCPICQESIRIKGKGSMQYHISKVHKDEKNFECDICHLKFTLFHHLKNHKRLMHDVIVNNSAVNSDEDDEPASPTDTLDENEVPDKNDVNEEVDSVKEKVQIVKSTRTTRSGAVYETTTSLIREDKTASKKPPNSSSKVKNDNPNKDNQSKSHSDKIDDSNSASLKSEESMRTLRSRSALAVSLAGKSNSKEKESPKANEEKTKKVIKASGSDDKKAKHDDSPDFDDDAEEDKFANSENGNESDDEEDSESDSEIEEKKKYFCDKCEMGFSHVFKLRHHKKKKHSSVWSNSGGEGFMVKNESLTCKLCQKKCRSEHQLNDHVLQHKSSGDKAKGTAIDSGQSSSLRKPITSTRSSTESSDSQLRIDESETEDPTEGTPLKSGEIPAYIVRKGRIYFCTKCDLSFKRERQMTYHLKKIHEALYPFRKCPDCPRVFRSSGPFTRHLREHRGKRCPIDGCKAKYKVLRMIKKHQRHAHPKFPHRCTRCVALFAKESELESHTKNEHKDSSSRRNSRDEDDDDDEEEEEVEEECEEEEEEEEEEEDEDEEEDEEEEKHEKDREKEEKSKVQINKNRQESSSNFSKKSSNSGNNTKVIESLLEGSTTGVRRTRSANISYKEDDDDDDYEFGIDKTIPIRTNPLPVQVPTTSIAEPLQQQEELKKPSFPSHPNPLKNLREAIMMQTASKAKPPLTTTEDLPPSVKPKRPYVRRAPYKKRKVDNSWTAAVKAQYQSFPSSESSDTTIVSPSPNLHTDSMSDPSPMFSSPGITADVVRRVAESLLNRHQEQQQQQQEQHQKQQQLHHNRYHNLHPHHHLPQNPQNPEKPLKPQKRPYRRRKPCNPVNPSFISYNAKSQLPRITYSSLVAASASRENSMSSMDDSSHADPSEYYGTSFSSGSGGRYFSLRHNNQTRIPEDEDSGPPKVLRFDSF
ncbi:UNVERIFIED_CONTAM: hypothetical protein RMT77_013598 [Armadillidium vulgare]